MKPLSILDLADCEALAISAKQGLHTVCVNVLVKTPTGVYSKIQMHLEE